ncbi:39S ribosomal protein L9, mitochondrial [Octopus sinensis]|nr:39S ribosomal protein L9, mitochondrial [Octopus sinensis]
MVSLIRRLPQCGNNLFLQANKNHINNSCLVLTRNTVILKRQWAVPLTNPGDIPHLKDKHRVFKFVENTDAVKLPDIQCILTDNIDGIGYKNELVTVKRKFFRNVLYPAGLAMYASPENVEKFAVKSEEFLGSRWARLTLKTLSNMYLAIPMSGDNPWVLSKEHVVVAFRLRGVEVAEEAITLPDKVITEPEEIDIQLKMNGKEEVTVKCLIILKHKDPSKDVIPTNLPTTLKRQKKHRQIGND